VTVVDVDTVTVPQVARPRARASELEAEGAPVAGDEQLDEPEVDPIPRAPLSPAPKHPLTDRSKVSGRKGGRARHGLGTEMLDRFTRA